MRRLGLLPAIATLAGCIHHPPDPAIEASKSAIRAAHRDIHAAEVRADRYKKHMDEEDTYRAERKAVLVRALREKQMMKSDTVVAVLGVDDHDAKLGAAERAELSAYIGTAILERTASRIVPPDRLRSALIDQKTRSYRSCYDESCQIELGRALAADQVLEPMLFAEQDGCKLGMTLYDLATETTAWAASIATSCGLFDLFEATEGLTRQLAEHEREARR